MASGVSAPSPSPGAEAAVVAKVRGAIQILQHAMAGADPSSELGKVIMDCIRKLADKAPSSQSTAGMESTAQGNIAQDAKKKAMLQAIMQKMAQGQQGGQPQPPAAPAASPSEGE